jgi:hypothetical protein
MFSIDPELLDGAAGRIADAASVLTCLDVSGPVTAGREGLPGSETATGCLWLASRFDAAIDVWADNLVDLCETARMVARDAAEVDRGVADDYGGMALR